MVRLSVRLERGHRQEPVRRAPSNLRGHAEKFKRYETIDALLGGFSNSIKLNGKKGDLSAYEPPSEDATDEAKAEHSSFLKVANRVPEGPEGYGLERPEGMSDEDWAASGAKYSEIAHRHNLSPEAVGELYAFQQEFATAQENAAQAQIEAYRAGEREALKQAHPTSHEEIAGQAKRVINRFDLDDSVLSSAKNVEAFAKIAKLLGEDNLPGFEADPDQGMTDRQKGLDIVNNPSNPMHKAYHDPNHPQHDEALKLKSKLTQSWERSRKAG